MYEQKKNLLQISGLHAFYGESHILHGIDISVDEGEIVTLLGRNGSGRTTILKSIMGLVGRRTGSIRIDGIETVSLPTHRVAHLGVGYCPEERGIFSRLTVEENLLLPPAVNKNGMPLDKVYDMFPNLFEQKDSMGTRLSGGEQQMLAIARILRTGARLLLLDEITEGLAPIIKQTLGRLMGQLKEEKFTILLVEQNFRFAAPLADRHYIIDNGIVAETVTKNELDRKMDQIGKYLWV